MLLTTSDQEGHWSTPVKCQIFSVMHCSRHARFNVSSKTLLQGFLHVCSLLNLISMICLFLAGLNAIKVNVSHRMNSTTFAAINKLGSGLKKKGKKKKGKPGKVFTRLPVNLIYKLCKVDFAWNFREG